MESSGIVCVRNIPKEQDLKITFCYGGQLRGFNRAKSEPLSQTLKRISLKLLPKKKKKKNQVEEAEITEFKCCLLEENIEIDANLSNEECFAQGRVLQINEAKLPIVVNPPRISHFSLPQSIITGFPIIPDIKLENAQIEHSKFEWFVSKPDQQMSSTWTSVGTEVTYVPKDNDVGCLIKCQCFPGDNNEASIFYEEVTSEESVKAGPKACLFDQRHVNMPRHHLISSSRFRLVSYNVLANIFADCEFGRKELFPYCPAYAIKQDFRRQLLFKELVGYHADLVCLQECSKREFEHYMQNWMSLNGYIGFQKLKVGQANEGEALFFRNDRYQHIKDLSVSVKDALYSPSNRSILDRLSSRPSVFGYVTDIAVGQIHLLKEKDGEKKSFCVLNTHLSSIISRRHARLLQMVILLNYISENLKEFEDTFSILVCGDFNTTVGNPLLQYLHGEIIDEAHEVWCCSEDDDENFLNLVLQCPFELTCLSGYPKFTIFTQKFKDTLDYIFGDTTVCQLEVAEIPSAKEIKRYTGIPCVAYPSDHFALIADLEWNKK